MKKMFIICNTLKDNDGIAINKIKKILDENSILYEINYITKENADDNCITDKALVPVDTNLILAIGGDGTLIQASRDLRSLDIPLIGMNMGHLGYLTEIEINNLDACIKKLLEEDYKIESRIMLEGEVYRDGKCIYSDIALNDIVIGRDNSLKVINFELDVNGKFLNRYNADGVIISTPTGSTAYNLSAGGPIIEPNTNIVSVTPICSHTLNNRSIILSANSDIEVRIYNDRYSEESNTRAYFDGNPSVKLLENDILRIKKSELKTDFIKLNQMSFIERLHKKMN
ncbi:NAD+ kinase [Lachnospiraceae bacterium RM5]|nr:NAD+ kinase [Lachnospiraceae bacterium RM5]